jgi:N-methylhydantoinase A/acetophenone carboxylase
VHASSGVARVATSIAVGTYSAGPSAGLSGAEDVSRRLGDRLVLTADMGGTTLDLGLVTNGRCEVELRPSIAGVRVALPMNRTSSYGTGGGSLVSLVDGAIRVGPESAGAVPGPAAFGRGGRRATVTDVDLVAGLLEDGAVLGGEVTLSRAAALGAVGEVAAQLGVAPETAAGRIEARIDEQLGGAMAAFLAERGVAPADVTLYGFGGAGPLHFARAASVAGIRRLRTFPYGGVFSAFGCTAVDVRHRYEVLVPDAGLDRDAACSLVGGMVRRAGWDVSAEGFANRGGRCRLLVEGADGRELAATPAVTFGAGVSAALVEAAWPWPAGATTAALIVEVPTGELRAPGSTAANPAGAVDPGLRAGRAPSPAEDAAEPPRQVWWSEAPTSVPVVDIRPLADDPPGAITLRGPALLRDGDVVLAVPAEWSVRREPDSSLLWERDA